MNSRVKSVVVILCLVACAAVGYFLLGASTTFPGIAPGTYEGRIVGVREDNAPVTFFLERKKGTNKLLVVVFEQGWKPQAVLLQYPEDEEVQLDFDGPFQPIVLARDDRSYRLVGSQKSDGYGGTVFEGEVKRGTWRIARAEGGAVTLSNQEEVSPVENSSSFLDWMNLKAQYDSAKRELDELTSEFHDKTRKYEKLQQFVKEEARLKDRASDRRKSLNEQLKNTTEDRDKQVQKVKGLVNELLLMRRISKQGQAIELARKVSNRENNWYRANWGEKEDHQGLEEFVGGSLKIDFRKLDAAYARANDVRDLQRRVAEERERIRQLEAQLSRPPGEMEQPLEEIQPVEETPRNSETPKDKRERSFWDDIVG